MADHVAGIGHNAGWLRQMGLVVADWSAATQGGCRSWAWLWPPSTPIDGLTGRASCSACAAMGDLGHHLMLRLEDDRVIAPGDSDRRILARTVLE